MNAPETTPDDLILYRSAYRRNGARVEPIPGADHRAAGRALQRLLEAYRPLQRSIAAGFPQIDDATAESIFSACVWRDLLAYDPQRGSVAAFLRTAYRRDLIDEAERLRYHHESTDPLDETGDLHDVPAPDHAPDTDRRLDAMVQLTPILTALRHLTVPGDLLLEIAVARRLRPALDRTPAPSIDEIAKRLDVPRGVARGLCTRADRLVQRAAESALAQNAA